MTERRTLTPDDWIEAAFQALTAQGPRGIRAEALARGLGVSKGSFYWHFADVPALEAAMLTRWEETAVAALTAEAAPEAADPEDRLHALIEAATAGDDGPFGGRHVETALREWARTDDRAGQLLARVEAQRLAHLRDLLIGASARQPGRAARLIYAALIGMEALPRQDAEDSRKDMALLLKKLLP